MAVALNVDIFEEDGEVAVRHTFFADSEEEAQEVKQEHMAHCEQLRKADAEGRTGEWSEEIDDDDVPNEEDYEEESG